MKESMKETLLSFPTTYLCEGGCLHESINQSKHCLTTDHTQGRETLHLWGSRGSVQQCSPLHSDWSASAPVLLRRNWRTTLSWFRCALWRSACVSAVLYMWWAATVVTLGHVRHLTQLHVFPCGENFQGLLSQQLSICNAVVNCNPTLYVTSQGLSSF